MKKIALIILTIHCSLFTVHSFSQPRLPNQVPTQGRQACLPQGITFNSQEQIDNFQANYPGCIEIEGDVVINGDDISNLNGLNVLTAFWGDLLIGDNNYPYNGNPLLTSLTGLVNVTCIGGDLWVHDNDTLTSLSGLDNLTSIGGDIEITSNNGLINLIGLNNVTSIGGRLSIHENALTSLTGLNNVTSIGGDLRIWDNESLINLTGINNLTSIGGGLSIVQNGILSSLSGLDNINHSSITDITIAENISLSHCNVQNICDYLASPGGTIEIYGNADGCFNLAQVEEACNEFCLPEGITFSTQAQIDNFQANYPGCIEIEGDVEVNGDDITNLNGLNVLTAFGGDLSFEHTNLTNLSGLDNVTSIGGVLLFLGNDFMTSLTGLDNLTSIGGHLEIHGNDALPNLTGLENLTSILGALIIGSWIPGGNDALTSLSGLDNVTSIGGWLWIAYNPALISLTGLDNLTSIGSGISIVDNPALTSLMGLDNLTSISGGLYFVGNSSLTTLSSLENISSIEGDLIIGAYREGGNPSLTNLTGLDNVTSISGSLQIEWNYALTSLTGLDNVTSIGGYLRIDGSHALTNLMGLENLTSIGGNLDIGPYWFGGNHSLISLTGLDNVTSIGGNLSIIKNEALTSLTGLENLTSIDGALTIGGAYEAGNPSLNSLTGIENIEAESIDNLSITNNSSLSTCVVQSVCDYLASPNGAIEIHDNSPGCNSQAEVEEACQYIWVSEINSGLAISIYPNPAEKELFISGNNGAIIKELNIYMQTGQRVLHEKRLTCVIDISMLRQGMYIIEVVTNESKIQEKLIIK